MFDNVLKTLLECLIVGGLIVIFSGCSKIDCGTYEVTDLGTVDDYYHRDGNTYLKTKVHFLILSGVIPVKLGSRVELREWSHPSAPAMRMAYFPDYDIEAVVIDHSFDIFVAPGGEQDESGQK